MREKERLKLRLRASLFFWCCCAIAVYLIARLFGVQVREGAGLAAMAGEEQRAVFKVDGRRGDILDRFGVPFATTIASSAISARPHDLGDIPATARALAPLLAMPRGGLEAAMRENADFIYLKRDVPRAIADRIARLGLRGIGVDDEPQGLREDPQGRVGSTLIGFTGVDDQGLAGVEVGFDDELTGKPGQVEEATDNANRPIPFGRRVVTPPVMGDTVVLTIDRMLEFEAEDVLSRTVARYHADGGSAIVMRAQTGEILALANSPNFDPNDYSSSPASAWRDRAITDPYEPGSTFKLVTAAAALDSGKVSLDDTFPAVDAIEVGDRVIHNADDGLMASGHSRESLDEIIAYSHNVGAAEVAMSVGKQTMYDYIRRFGIDRPTGVDLPGESGGLVGTPDAWYGSRLATIGFGQGVSVTALQLADIYCAIANGGELMRPLIVRTIVGTGGRPAKSFAPQVERRVMKPQTAAELLAMLRDVVKFGTASAVRLPGYDIAGKTGTAQMVVDGAYVPGAYTSSFVGIVPADRPQYVILVKIDHPQGEYYGSIVAAPAFQELASRVLWREGVLPKAVTAQIDDPSHAAFARKTKPGNGRQLR